MLSDLEEPVVKLVSCVNEGKETFGAVVDESIVDLGAALCHRYADLKAFVKAQAWVEGNDAFKKAGASIGLNEVKLLPVIPNPGKILCIGHNYKEHRLETKRATTAHPSVFLRYAESQVAHGQPILRPRELTMLDYEGETAIVIGRHGRRISEADAWSHVAGFSCYNDGSVRDWQWHTSQFAPGKNFFRTGAFGPWLTTTDEIAIDRPMSLSIRLNGQTMQQSETSKMLFPIPRSSPTARRSCHLVQAS